MSLSLPSATAFAFLGFSCGGIQQQDFATGFDTATARPTGAVYLQTRCGGSGRGGGYKTTVHAAWIAVRWDFTGRVVASVRMTAPPAVSPAAAFVDAQGDQERTQLTSINVAPSACAPTNTTYCTYRALLTAPLPAAPTAVHVAQQGDGLVVSWTAPSAPTITSSIITARPVSSTSPTVTTAVSGSASSGVVGPVAPATTYAITVASSSAGGLGLASAPASFTTEAATIPPGAPRSVTARWTLPDEPGNRLVAQWMAPATSGNSPIDEYQVVAAPTEGPVSAQTLTVPAPAATSFTVDDTWDWTVKVRAHNAAGWGPWAASATLPAAG